MNNDNYEFQEDRRAQHHHVHYHYHYYYPQTAMQESRITSYSHQQPVKLPYSERPRLQTQQNHQRKSSFGEWKNYLNPEVSRMYDQYRANQSRLSQNRPLVTLQEQEIPSPSPRRSDVLHTAYYSSTKGNRSKLDELYHLSRQRNNEFEQVSKSQITGITGLTSNEAELKLKDYMKEIERLKRYQQECNYLRNRFYLHVVSRHPEEVNK